MLYLPNALAALDRLQNQSVCESVSDSVTQTSELCELCGRWASCIVCGLAGGNGRLV